MELHATEFERFMYKTKGVGDDKSELWLKDRGELAKYRDGDCRWPKTLRTAWKKRGYDSHRDAAVTMVPYCPFAVCCVLCRVSLCAVTATQPVSCLAPGCVLCAVWAARRRPCGGVVLLM